jgi:hypothetical protein
MKIEAVSIDEHKVKYEGKWHKVIGKAADFLNRTHDGDDKEVKEDKYGNVTFIGNANDMKFKKDAESFMPDEPQFEPPKPTVEERLARIEDCLCKHFDDSRERENAILEAIEEMRQDIAPRKVVV